MQSTIRAFLLLIALVLAGCGSRGQLATSSALQSAMIKGFTQVVVLDFHANDRRPTLSTQDQAERDKNVNEGRVQFADRIAERIAETKAFSLVSRTPVTGKFLLVTGTVDVWEPGNVVHRAVTGFVGQSQFASTIRLLDGQTGEELAKMTGHRNSWPLPIGASTTILQTVDYFMDEAASNMATQLAAAKNLAP